MQKQNKQTKPKVIDNMKEYIEAFTKIIRPTLKSSKGEVKAFDNFMKKCNLKAVG